MTGEPHDLEHIMQLIEAKLDAHVQAAHAHDEVSARRNEAIVDTLMGPTHPITGERIESEGVVYMVRELYRKSENGGVPAKLTHPVPARLEGKDRAYVLGALIAGVSGVMVALLS